MFRFRSYLTGAALSCAAVSLAQAQAEPQELEAFISEEIPIEENILPTSRPFVSLYGTKKSIVDTPRNVTIISREQLDAISIRDPRDFTKVTSSAYTQSNFGAPSNPSIRGQTADVLVNGMRRGLTTNGNGLPVNFNAVESVNILKGPPSVAVGASQYVGGSVDLITKKPFFSGNETFLNSTFDSEGLFVVQLDTNYVLNEEAAIRLSYTVENTDDYYYDNAKRKTHALYAAATFVPSDTYRIDLSGEIFYADYSENWGWNRVTQSLLDDGIYIAGGSNDPNDLVFGVGGTQAAPQPFGFTVTDVNDPDNLVSLSRTERLLANGDDSKGYLLTLQAIQTFTPDAEYEIINNTFFQYRDRDTYSSYQYSEVLRDNWQLENRTEFLKEIEIGNILNNINTGASVRWTHVTASNDFFHEPANFWDITQGPASIGVTDNLVFFDNAYNNLAGTATSVPILGEEARGLLTLGRPGTVGGDYGTFILNPSAVAAAVGATNYWVDPKNGGLPTAVLNSNGDTNESDVFNFGIYLQNDIKFTEWFSLLVGGRIDFVDAEASDPLFDDAVAYLERFGQAGEAQRLINLGRDTASVSEEVYNFNISAVFKPTEKSSVYLTYNFAEATARGLGGGVSVQQVSNPDAFVLESELFEVGYKLQLLDDKAYLAVALFDQTRTDPVQGGASVETQARGFEFEANYQPNRKFFITFSYAYIDATATSGGFTAAARTFDTAGFGGSGGATNFAGLGTGETDSPGVPNHVANFLVSYKLTENLGFTAAGQLTGPFVLGYENGFNFAGDSLGLSTAEVDWQHSLDLGVFYEMGGYKVRFNILNALDQENLGAVNPVYGNASVFIELPRRYELSFDIEF